jgi:DNA-binding MarR family transcriptional regulator
VSHPGPAAFARRLEGFDVSVAEVGFVLRNLYDRRMLQAIWRSAWNDPAAASRSLPNRLAGKQLVAREAAAGDRRVHVWCLSEAGRQLVPELARLAEPPGPPRCRVSSAELSAATATIRAA